MAGARQINNINELGCFQVELQDCGCGVEGGIEIVKPPTYAFENLGNGAFRFDVDFEIKCICGTVGILHMREQPTGLTLMFDWRRSYIANTPIPVKDWPKEMEIQAVN